MSSAKTYIPQILVDFPVTSVPRCNAKTFGLQNLQLSGTRKHFVFYGQATSPIKEDAMHAVFEMPLFLPG
jgi:hypothetical protein